ncbi:MCE family protein [Mycobacterium syngnathidarum]
MTASARMRIALSALLVGCLIAGAVAVLRISPSLNQIHVVGYFDNTNGMFVGDEVRILGVPVGTIDKIEAEPHRVKVSFSYAAKYRVPADANAAILSPSLVTSRAIQLTPAYTGGPVLADNAVIPQERTAVPVEWDDFRVQLEKLTESLKPTGPGGLSTLGELVSTGADNLRGEGGNVRDTLIKMSQAFSALGDHSEDLFSSVRNLATLVSALQSSTDLMSRLNRNFAGVTALLANDPDEIGNSMRDLNVAVADVQGFLAENRESLGTTSDKLASVSQALNDSLDDIKQTLHVAPTSLANFLNIYNPAQNALTGMLAVSNFNNPVSFLCGAIQAASRLGAEQSAKLCVQYLAPIIKNRQYNFLPFGMNPIVGTQARPNEITYSEDWMRPDHVPAAGAPETPRAATEPAQPQPGGPLPAEAGTGTGTVSTDPGAGLSGLMVPPTGAGS